MTISISFVKKKVGSLVQIINGYPFNSDNFSTSGIPLIRIRDIGRSTTQLSYAGPPQPSAVVSNKDLLIGMDGDFNLGRWKSPHIAYLNQRCLALRSEDRSLLKLLEFCLPLPLKTINDLTYATTVKHLSTSQVSKIEILLPESDSLLKRLVAYLLRETTKIDKLIAKQQKLIKLLQEKRQAVISQAVTKGLDSNVKMKDSGVEWLGEVPAHWKVIKGGLIGRLFGSDLISEEAVNDSIGIPFLKVSTMSASSTRINNIGWFVNSAVLKGRKAPFVVFPKRGAAIFTNKVARVDVDALLDPNLMGWKLSSFCDVDYMVYLLKTRRLDELADVSTVPQINNKHIEPVRFPIPPLEEQKLIVEHLETNLSSIDFCIEKALKSIALLKEHRQALITAAVTGKIDIRGLVTDEEVEALDQERIHTELEAEEITDLQNESADDDLAS